LIRAVLPVVAIRLHDRFEMTLTSAIATVLKFTFGELEALPAMANVSSLANHLFFAYTVMDWFCITRIIDSRLSARIIPKRADQWRNAVLTKPSRILRWRARSSIPRAACSGEMATLGTFWRQRLRRYISRDLHERPFIKTRRWKVACYTGARSAWLATLAAPAAWRRVRRLRA